MNYWGHQYPSTMESVIHRCEQGLASVEKCFASNKCCTINDLYKEKDGRVRRMEQIFDELGHAPNAILNSKDDVHNELKGLYVFGEIVNSVVLPRYVGISGTIIRRLKQHGWGKQHNEATLAYLMAAAKTQYNGKRAHLSYSEIRQQQDVIRQYKVVVLPELQDFDLYFMEVYFAGKLKTLWNNFKTH